MDITFDKSVVLLESEIIYKCHTCVCDCSLLNHRVDGKMMKPFRKQQYVKLWKRLEYKGI